MQTFTTVSLSVNEVLVAAFAAVLPGVRQWYHRWLAGIRAVSINLLSIWKKVLITTQY